MRAPRVTGNCFMLFLYQVTKSSSSHEAGLKKGKVLLQGLPPPLPRCSSDNSGTQAGSSGLGLGAAADLAPLG